MKIAIIGAGIGGLTLALMAQRQGFEVEVWEAVQTLRPLGVGINLLPHAARQLCELGLEDTLGALAIRTSALAYYNRFGQPIWHEPRGLAAGYDWPQFSIHRGEFQMALADAVMERLGRDAVHLGHSFEAVRSTGEGGGPVRFTLRDRANDAVVESSADVLIGADGIHSAVRRHFYPTGDTPRFAGRMLWRAVTEGQPYLDGRTMFMAGHQDQKFVAYPISEPLRQQGRSRINWIAELRVPDEAPPRSDWNREVDRAIFRSAFADWKWDWIDIPALIDGAQAVYEFPLVDKDPLPRWTFGRVTLLGDAAHPMYPIGSNGSAQAILDARALIDCLLSARDTGIALREYEADRLPRTAGIVLRNRLNGPEQVMQLAHERAPQGFARIDDVIPRAELEGIAMRYKKLAGFDPQSLRDQPPMPARAGTPA
ncbi:flavin-dependent oxidoreductase [Ralstonia mannitolilytica]|uniref:5-methylphenazine-1-carboxylate 1-monooxygenase n=1 Tax=Ralstonia mannitolilytica TaxID=105219 RepID=A0AAD2ARR3_9RALS|nr:flavin-dependent oxidoreductase [Ralstonia mannitolilytica]MBY4717820.1 flavin-dependent oxidoreductase [Ralstonia mannitolilytica]CAJ0683535.1 5-methylphenazine-1-carboxylate 1-monooxygenase [Ralstonia mannitolilytica]CAJ0691131.1 5-methylphenazine-1-carboxylate 1-monooxygenase [Ralstonia mannitolilytica]CAJ0709058.1 5-methylphenazine-1-carboxylate 1-monooxygenase [Ralstonia mannitolilytica]CAJ0891435.1 5-methylphenazine-1-carboxylate 1-monooxygenase [Ralstonia mannitolilytica]